MSASFKSLVLSFCGHGDALQSAALALQARARSMSYPDYRNEAARIVGEKYGVEPHESRKGGLLTFAKDSAPEQRLTRILALHPGKPTQKTEAAAPVIRPRIVSKAVATTVQTVAGMTKAEFNEFMRTLRDSVTFE